MSSSAPEMKTPPAGSETFLETALKLSGKSETEARTTGAIDRADENVEKLFAEKYQTTGSPIHKGVWERTFPIELFFSQPASVPADTEQAMRRSLEAVKRHRDGNTLLDEKAKIRPEVLNDLSRAGYWGLLVDREYGGSGTPFVSFAKFLTQMATIEPTVAGLASVHGCIGAVDPIRTFGNPEQKRRYLPRLASGEALSAFALTEPGAGSDLTALKTRAVLDGNEYVVHGEKLFITNAIPGRTIGLVCLIDEKPAVLIAELPERENEQFQLVRYGLHALRHAFNNGLIFNGFRVPKENRLNVEAGDGLTIAYHGLNRGRVALCANAAGTMRVMLANIIPWAKFRNTYGAAIGTRELVQRRMGRLAGFIVACDAMTEWCGSLLDQGYRGEMECIIAKIFGSEVQKEAAIELFMKTHGGRSFLHGHLLGDYVHEFLAPCIYEGEGEMLGMAFLKSLIKQHGKEYFEPVGVALHKAGMKTFSPMNPMHVWKLRGALVPYARWLMGQKLSGWRRPELPRMPETLARHAYFAAASLQESRLVVDALMRKFQLKLPDRQCMIADLSQRIQDLVVILTTCLWASRQENELVHQAADVISQELTARYYGRRLSGSYYRNVTGLGKRIADGGFHLIAGVEPFEILHSYAQK